MLPFRRILFPVDYSEPCCAVVPYVRETMQHFSASLTLIHAYGPEALAFSELPITDPMLPGEAQAIEEQRLRDFAAKQFPGVHADLFVEIGEAGSAIHRVVQREGTDLVMLSTHGRGPLRRLLLGSIAAKVLHDVSAAVWTGTGKAIADHTPSATYKTVLCAIDGGEESEASLMAGASIAASYKAELRIVHAVEMPPVPVETGVILYEKEIMQASEDRLRNLKGKLGIDAPHAVIRGFIPEVICDEAARVKADLIVAGRGQMQGAMTRMWSHLYNIVRLSPCPVLSI